MIGNRPDPSGGDARRQCEAAAQATEGVRMGEKCVLAYSPGQDRVFHGKRQHAVNAEGKRMMRSCPDGRSPFPFWSRRAGPVGGGAAGTAAASSGAGIAEYHPDIHRFHYQSNVDIPSCRSPPLGDMDHADVRLLNGILDKPARFTG